MTPLSGSNFNCTIFLLLCNGNLSNFAHSLKSPNIEIAFFYQKSIDYKGDIHNKKEPLGINPMALFHCLKSGLTEF
jgi:hypothetical protein